MPLALDRDAVWARFLWRFRTVASNVASFGGKTRAEEGQNWWEWYRWQVERYRPSHRITYADMATHNHFAIDFGGKVFNRSAPIINLPQSATDDDHFALLAYLNSSTVWFYLRQVAHCKGAQGVNEGYKSEIWEQFIQFSGSVLGTVPLPPKWRSIASLGKTVVAHAEELERVMPRAWFEQWSKGAPMESLRDFGTPPRDMQQRLVALQEEVDWAVYRLFGLVDEPFVSREKKLVATLYGKDFQLDVRHDSPSASAFPAGSRPFEQLLDLKETQWFARNQYAAPVPVADWTGPLGDLLRLRMEAIGKVNELRVIEQPEYKHRWSIRDVGAEAVAATTDWASSTIESLLRDAATQKPSSLFTDWLRAEGLRASSVVERYFNGNGRAWVEKALAENAVPFLAQYRYTDSGLEKSAAWEHTWDLQRREDAGEQIRDIPVPPKYDKEDYRDPNYYRLRGKLDVPKERFISYPGCESDEDKEPVYGWAGWNHLQRAQALAQLYNSRREEGWGKDRLQPMLAGLLELMPWLLQWHNEPSEELGGQRPGEQFSLFLEGQCAELGFTHEDLRAWRPVAKRGKGKKGDA